MGYGERGEIHNERRWGGDEGKLDVVWKEDGVRDGRLDQAWRREFGVPELRRQTAQEVS